MVERDDEAVLSGGRIAGSSDPGLPASRPRDRTAVGLTGRLGARELGARELARDEGRVAVGETERPRPALNAVELAGPLPRGPVGWSSECDLTGLREGMRDGRGATVQDGLSAR